MTMQSIVLDDVAPASPLPGMRGKFIHSECMTFIYWEIDEGAVLPRHSHPHEQVLHLLAGQYELGVGGDTRVLTAGSVTIIPSDVEHGGRALTPCRIMDAFCPVREDYRRYAEP